MSTPPKGQWNEKDTVRTPAGSTTSHARNHEQWNAKLANLKHESTSNEACDEVDGPMTELSARSTWKRIAGHMLRLLVIFLISACILSIPCWAFAKYAYNVTDPNDSVQTKNLLFWIFAWFELTLIFGFLGYLLGLILPYAFYCFAHAFNPAWRRYWRIPRPFVWPITILSATVWGVIFFNLLIEIGGQDFVSYKVSEERKANAALNNETLTDYEALEAANDAQTLSTVTSIINQILGNCIFWAIAYMFQKLLITYVSIHYHYRSGHSQTQRSKALIGVLVKLYEASLSLFPLYSEIFREQDIAIRYAIDADCKKRRKIEFFDKIGGVSQTIVSAFGTLLGSTAKSHWFKPGASYSVVEQALNSSVAAQALAQRIWLSFVPASEDALTKEHIAEILGFGRREEADDCFATLDEDENGDIRLSEFEPMIVDHGQGRLEVYQNLININHNINTLSWILHIQIGLLMIYVIAVNYVSFLQYLQQTFSFVCLGASFAVGRVVAEFGYGVMFVLFKHPFDIGDRVDLYNRTEALLVGVKVKRISLLYCVFERTDTGATVQWSNQALWDKRIENHTRSGCAAEKFTLTLDIGTSFKDLEYLRDEVKAFLVRPENRRDYRSNVALRVKGIHELNKLEITMVINHKSNWSNDALKSARSSRIYCLLLDLARRMPLSQPLDRRVDVGDATRPLHSVIMTEQEANNNKLAEARAKGEERYDFPTEARSNQGEKAREKPLPQEPAIEAAKTAERKAYMDISAVPSTMDGRRPERGENLTSSLPFKSTGPAGAGRKSWAVSGSSEPSSSSPTGTQCAAPRSRLMIQLRRSRSQQHILHQQIDPNQQLGANVPS